MEITDKILSQFIMEELEPNDFGHLVIPDDEKLNSEAAYIIKNKFRDWLEKQEIKSPR